MDLKRFSFANRRKISFVIFIIFIVFIWFWTDPNPKVKGSIKIYDRNENLIYESSNGLGHQEFVSIDKIPKELKDAIIAAEDERFWHHSGVDPQAIARALWQNISRGEIVSGASTIPQQLVRFTVISPQQPAQASILRKIREILMSVRLTLSTPKEKILQDYLNSMHFGRQTYGVAAASRLYFGKSVESLSLAQSALLAGLIANPSRFDPINHPDESLARRNLILAEMFQGKLINEEVYDRAKEENLPQEINEIQVIAPHAVQMVLEDIAKMNIKADKGLSVYTTLDSGWYELTRNIAKNQVEKLRYDHDLSNAAVVILENNTGEIVSLLGSVDYFNETIGGQNNMALALRQPGSSIKPVTYAAAFEDKIATPATAIEDIPKVYLTQKGEGFLPHNYDGRYHGIVLAREALASSYNLPAVEMLSRVGIDRFLDLAHKMGVSSMRESDRYDLALTLGGGEVNLLELTNLYATFARGGIYIPTSLIDKITSGEGKVIFESKTPEGKSVLDEKTAWLITDILSDTKARIPTFGEKNLLVVSVPAAVKTGTTTDWHDNWTIGYTSNYTIGVWVGNADNHPMRDITGITGAAPIWNQIMQNIIKFSPKSEFTKPDRIIEKEVCAWDGLSPTDFCREKYIEKFIAGTEPTSFTTLTQEPSYLNASATQIVSPIEGAVYEIGAQKDEKVNFELTQYDGLTSFVWILDDKRLGKDDCGQDKFICHWPPSLGEHTLSVEVEPARAITPIHFSVREYKKGW